MHERPNASGVGFAIFLIVMFAVVMQLLSRQPAAEYEPSEDARAATGGAQTVDDIMARQQGLDVDDTFRRMNVGDPDSAAGIAAQLGTLGGASDPDLWRALRYGSSDISVSNNSPGGSVLMQDGGMRWLEIREGPLRTYGGWLLVGMLLVLALFYGLRGKIRIEHGRAGVNILRFNALERFGHWLLAGSFILLGVTGIITLFGRLMIPYIGHEAFAPLAVGSKWVHNNVAWPFMIALVLVFVMWVLRNIPNRHDIAWLMQGGGLFTPGSHPPSRKFNAGQKIIFWSVIVLGGSISASGLSLLFPFELPMFAATFEKINSFGIPQLFGFAALPEAMSPHEEMQYAQLWHAIVSFVLMAIIIAHIYLGSVGMEGAYDAMGSGEVDLNWAKEHHGLWVEELEASGKTAPKGAAPAE